MLPRRPLNIWTRTRRYTPTRSYCLSSLKKEEKPLSSPLWSYEGKSIKNEPIRVLPNWRDTRGHVTHTEREIRSTSLFFLSGVSRRQITKMLFSLPPSLLDACMSLSPAINLQLPGLFERRKKTRRRLVYDVYHLSRHLSTVTMCTMGVEGCLISREWDRKCHTQDVTSPFDSFCHKGWHKRTFTWINVFTMDMDTQSLPVSKAG